MRSMTGFGSGTYSDEKISITVEIKAVNQRFAEFNIRIPRTYAALEERVRRQLKDVIHRGKTDVFVTVTELSKEPPGRRSDFLRNVGSYERLVRNGRTTDRYGSRMA